MTELDASATDSSALAARVRELEAQLVGAKTLVAQLEKERAKLAEVTAERDRLRRAYTLLLEQHELLRRRLFVAKAERVDVTQLELEFAETKAKLDALAKQLGMELKGPPWPPPESPLASQEGAPPPGGAGAPKGSSSTKSKGRRNLRLEDIKEETRIELTDPTLDSTWKFIGFEDSYRYGYRRGCAVRVVLARAKYKKIVDDGNEAENEEPAVEIVTVKKPKELVERGLLAPSLIAHMLVAKYRFGIPFHRLVEMLRAQGVRLDDGTMCRYAEDVGATLGCIVDAMAKESKETAFCLST